MGGVLATFLLAPVLAHRDGIPSPSAILAADAPWQGNTDVASGNPVLRDVTYQIEPWLLHLRRELRAGRLPLWNPYQGAGTPFWGNGQSAPLFPLHLLFVVLPLRIGWLLLPWLRIATAAAGAFTLARALGRGDGASTLAAVVFGLSGMLVGFCEYPMGSALALLPWVLWAVERIAAGDGSWRALAALGGLQLLAGHPETCAHTALFAALWLLVRGASRPRRAWMELAAGWVTAAALAAVQVLPFVLTARASSRYAAWARPAGAEPPLALLALQPLRLVLPQLYGDPAHGTWWGPFNYLALATYCGVLALPLAFAGAAGARSDRRLRAALAVLALGLLGGYHAPLVRDLLSALPVIGHALHHRLVMGLELGLALLAAAGLERWREGRDDRALAWGALLPPLLLALAWLRFHADWRGHAQVMQQARWTAWALLASAIVLAMRKLPAPRRPLVATVVIALGAADPWTAHHAINPTLRGAVLFPATGATRFLAAQEGRVAGTGGALHPNASMVYGLRDVRVDDPVKMVRYEAVNAALGGAHPTYFRPITRWDSPWLDELGVRWVMTAPGETPPHAGWPVRYRGPDAAVYERPSALPLVRWEDGATPPPVIVERTPGTWRVRTRAATPRRLVVAEIWDRGWRASWNRRPLPVELHRGALLAVTVPAGNGVLALGYRPPGIVVGGWCSALAALTLAGGALARRRRAPT